jgi:hypothetical protein
MSGCTPIDVSTVGDQQFRSSPIRIRVAAATGGATHRDRVQRTRSYNGVLIDISTVL